jgi:hypothetical protein
VIYYTELIKSHRKEAKLTTHKAITYCHIGCALWNCAVMDLAD